MKPIRAIGPYLFMLFITAIGVIVAVREADARARMVLKIEMAAAVARSTAINEEQRKRHFDRLEHRMDELQARLRAIAPRDHNIMADSTMEMYR